MNISDFKKNKILSFFGLIAILLNFSSCKKDLEQISLKQISDSKILYQSMPDTTTILAYSTIDDSVVTSNLSVNLLGSINDPIFGKTTTGIYTQLSFNNPLGLDFGSSPGIDSVILNLAYTGAYYGDTGFVQTVKVYGLNDTISISTSHIYYANSSISADTLLGSKSFTGRPHQKYLIGPDSMPHLSIKLNLNNDFILRNILSPDSASKANPGYFIKYFKGLYITTDPVNQVGGAIYNINLSDATTNLTIYYHNATTTTTNLSQSFYFNGYCRSFENFNHDYSNANSILNQNLKNQNYKNGDSTLFLQAMSGVRIKLKFPYLNTWSSKGNLFVNRAELIIPVDTTQSTNKDFSPPANVYLWTVNSNGVMLMLQDFSSSYNYIKQTYDTIRKAYVCDISSYIQKRINNKSILDDGLFVVVADRAVSANRIIINGPKRSKNKMKLNLTYINTKSNNLKK